MQSILSVWYNVISSKWGEKNEDEGLAPHQGVMSNVLWVETEGEMDASDMLL